MPNTNDTAHPAPDPIWDLAWSWVMRQHERDTFTDSAEAQLKQWLAADPAHRLAYDRAGRLWLAAGLVPPVNDIDIRETPDPQD
ncbi:FecR/PupR family sigma factor regulator [Duganella sp. HH101]|uniref:FecR/PupR family sigma factor regulator n=1 Tax=Duganella sp. HH101 TaxID=1781066 RepID=UPI0008749D41|nr:FecR/PupR family sigma factor regulator [Duganella sp. HH101]OFA06701.1 hypothetical protein DUGA2_00290 [Duganella sp. HH101]